MGKTTAFLAVLQLAVLAFVATGLEQAVREMAVPSAEQAQRLNEMTKQEGTYGTFAIPPERESQLRQIIGQELGSPAGAQYMDSDEPEQARSSSSGSPPYDPARVAVVNSQSDSFISAGRVSPVALAARQRDIAGLDEVSR